MSARNGTRFSPTTPDPHEFAGMAALVTGGSKGIGLAAARRLAAGGCAVTVCGRDDAAVADAIRQAAADGMTLRGLAADVSVADGARRAVESAAAPLGRLDILVNSAGIQRYGTVEDTPEETWDEVMDVNVKAMYLTAKHAVPHLRAGGGGAIVNVSSVQGLACQTGVAAYAASKGAINALTRAMALDHAKDGIRVVAVLPGSVDTPMLRWAADLFRGEATVDATVDDWGLMHPVGRVAAAEEVGELIAFLAGPRATFVTGADYRIDGALLSGVAVVLPER